MVRSIIFFYFSHFICAEHQTKCLRLNFGHVGIHSKENFCLCVYLYVHNYEKAIVYTFSAQSSCLILCKVTLHCLKIPIGEYFLAQKLWSKSGGYAKTVVYSIPRLLTPSRKKEKEHVVMGQSSCLRVTGV